FNAKVTIILPEGWHIYSNIIEKMGIPTTVQWQFSPDQKETLTVVSENWPEPIPFSVGSVSGKGYERTVDIFFIFKSTDKIDLKTLKLKATISWLACKDSCIPESQIVNATYQSNELFNQPEITPYLPINSTHFSIFTILSLFIFAFIGGLILNLMPCVFPVLSIKLFSLLKHSQTSKETRTQSFYFVLGILSVFWIFSIIMITLQSLSYAVGWGFHLQSPITIISLLIIFFLMGLNFFGLFEIGLNLTSVQTNQTSSKASSFLSGCLTTVVATPCTAPFMGTALGATLTTHPLVTFLIFTFLGLGLAFPFILLPFFPSFYKRLPRPGAWMEQLKQFFGFPMMATCVWLLFVLTSQTYSSIWTTVSLALILLAMSGWIFGSFQKSQKRWQFVMAILLFLLSIGLIFQNLEPKNNVIWEDFSSTIQQTYNENRQSYFIDATADWCVTCKVNEKHIESEEVLSKFKEKHVKLIKADWTLKNPETTALLNKYGRNGVPLYILYNGQTNETILLPQLLTKSTILNKLTNFN
ncbi:hypothetical protein HOH45_05150, partial [bacterium]|nr:hypothetical protein [bacterium]